MACLFFEFVGNRAKGRISKRVFQENKAHQIFLKTNISYPLLPLPLFGKFGVVYFLEATVLRLALLPYYGRVVIITFIKRLLNVIMLGIIAILQVSIIQAYLSVNLSFLKIPGGMETD